MGAFALTLTLVGCAMILSAGLSVCWWGVSAVARAIAYRDQLAIAQTAAATSLISAKADAQGRKVKQLSARISRELASAMDEVESETRN